MATRGNALQQPLTSARSGGLAYHWQAMIVIVLGAFMVILDTTIVNIAMPRIISVFQTSLDQSQLVLTGYMVALAIVMPATGYVAERFGSKRTYLVTIGLFTLGSALCGFAPNLEGLILFRVLQGLGGGMTQPLGMSILLGAAPPHQRGAVMGIFGLPILLAPVAGPTLGGYIVEYLDWRLIFTINIPVGVAAVLIGTMLLRETPTRAGGKFDWPGFILASTGFTAALLAFDKAPADGWLAPHVVVLWLVAALTIPAWIVVELASANPLLDLSIFKEPVFLVSTVVTMVLTVALFGPLLLLPVFLQNIRGLGAMETGMLMLPQALAAGLIMPISGRLVDRIGPRRLVIPGLTLLGFATYAFTWLDISTSDNWLRGMMLLRGIAMGTMMMPVTAVSMDNLAPWQIPKASALSNVCRSLFSAFGTCLMSSVLLDRTIYHTALVKQTVTPDNLAAMQMLSTVKLTWLQQGASEFAAEALALAALSRQATMAATIRAFDDCFYVGAALAFLGLLPAIFLRRGRNHQRGRAAGPGARSHALPAGE